MPLDLPPISPEARKLMQEAVLLGLNDVRSGDTFLPYLVIGGDHSRIEQMVPASESPDAVEAAAQMARNAVAELPKATAYAIIRDGFLHEPTGRVDALIVEFGMAGTDERHFAAQRYGRSRWLKRVRTIGGLVYMFDPSFTPPST